MVPAGRLIRQQILLTTDIISVNNFRPKWNRILASADWFRYRLTPSKTTGLYLDRIIFYQMRTKIWCNRTITERFRTWSKYSFAQSTSIIFKTIEMFEILHIFGRLTEWYPIYLFYRKKIKEKKNLVWKKWTHITKQVFFFLDFHFVSLRSATRPFLSLSFLFVNKKSWKS